MELSLRPQICSSFRTVPAYQPETAFEVFSRAIQGRDVSTGKVHLRSDSYCTKGPLSTWHIKNEVPPPVKSRCYILDPLRTCDKAQIIALRDGRAVIKDFVVVDILDEWCTSQGERNITRIRWIRKALASTYNAFIHAFQVICWSFEIPLYRLSKQTSDGHY